MIEVMSMVVIFLPLFVIVWVANVAEARRQNEQPYQGVALVAYIFLVVLYGGLVLLGLMMQVGAQVISANPEAFDEILVNFPLDSMPLVALGLWLPSLLGIILLLPPVRRLFASFTPIDPQSPVHAIALSLSMLVVINLLVTLGVGLGTLADLLAENEGVEGNTMLSLWTQQVLTALLAFVGVGWLTRRDWRQSLERLGLYAPNVREWLIAIGVGLGMVPVVLLIEALAGMLGLGMDADVERLTEQLLGGLFMSPLGILTIGLSAGLGEETLFRGALQPRLGLIMTSIFFALLHSQYGITLSTLVVLVLGFVLGWLRLRYNTTAAMITHAVYNMTLGLIAYFSASFLDF